MHLEKELLIKLREPSGKFYVYVMECRSLYKIGMTDHLKRRLTGVNTASPFDVVMVRAYEFNARQKANDFENHLHRMFKSRRLRNGLTGKYKEWFTIDGLDLAIIDAEHARVKEIKTGIINERIRPAYEFSKILSKNKFPDNQTLTK